MSAWPASTLQTSWGHGCGTQSRIVSEGISWGKGKLPPVSVPCYKYGLGGKCNHSLPPVRFPHWPTPLIAGTRRCSSLRLRGRAVLDPWNAIHRQMHGGLSCSRGVRSPKRQLGMHRASRRPSQHEESQASASHPVRRDCQLVCCSGARSLG